MLKAEDLNVYYGKIHAIKVVSFEVRPGEIVSLIGANGAGKTTTLHTVSGLLRSVTGSITFDGKNISHIEPHNLVRHGLSHVPEGTRFPADDCFGKPRNGRLFNDKNAVRITQKSI